MKISKLFHWLYALLMLLPFMFFIPSVLYYAFNDNATMQSVEVPKTETIAVDFNQKAKNGQFTSSDNWWGYESSFTVSNNICELTANVDASYPGLAQSFNCTYSHKYLFSLDYKGSPRLGLNAFGFNSFLAYDLSQSELNHVEGIITCVNDSIRQFTFFCFGTEYRGVQYFTNVNIFDLTQMYGSGNEPTREEFNQLFTELYYPYTESELMQITFDTGETEQLIQNTSIVNYAWESIWDLPLFNWCKVSFVAVPFTYITGLFGLSASNSFNYVFTYFASMSIIWLVFDVIMYVPLLVHRWLDKGIVE